MTEPCEHLCQVLQYARLKSPPRQFVASRDRPYRHYSLSTRYHPSSYLLPYCTATIEKNRRQVPVESRSPIKRESVPVFRSIYPLILSPLRSSPVMSARIPRITPRKRTVPPLADPATESRFEYVIVRFSQISPLHSPLRRGRIISRFLNPGVSSHV